MRIEVLTVPHECQRYPTVGDWIADEDGVRIRVSDMVNDDYHMLVAIHELVEAYLCLKRGISQEAVDAFDQAFEAGRIDDSEPGHDPQAPYHREHVFAEKIERMLAEEAGIDWAQYDTIVSNL